MNAEQFSVLLKTSTNRYVQYNPVNNTLLFTTTHEFCEKISNYHSDSFYINSPQILIYCTPEYKRLFLSEVDILPIHIPDNTNFIINLCLQIPCSVKIIKNNENHYMKIVYDVKFYPILYEKINTWINNKNKGVFHLPVDRNSIRLLDKIKTNPKELKQEISTEPPKTNNTSFIFNNSSISPQPKEKEISGLSQSNIPFNFNSLSTLSDSQNTFNWTPNK